MLKSQYQPGVTVASPPLLPQDHIIYIGNIMVILVIYSPSLLPQDQVISISGLYSVTCVSAKAHVHPSAVLHCTQLSFPILCVQMRQIAEMLETCFLAKKINCTW